MINHYAHLYSTFYVECPSYEQKNKRACAHPHRPCVNDLVSVIAAIK